MLALVLALLLDGPAFEKVTPVEKKQESLKPTLADIDSQLDSGHHYRHSNKMTWAHETTHGINARLRNARRGRLNAFYCLDNQAVYIVEPNILIEHVAPRIPRIVRGLSYNLYLNQQRRWWNDRPLYILDEWVAYTNGALAGKEYGLPEWEYELHRAHNFNIYAITLLKVVEEKDPNYDRTELQRFIKWNIERVFRYTPLRRPKHIEEYLNHVKSSPEVEEVRVYARRVFGIDWCMKHYGF